MSFRQKLIILLVCLSIVPIVALRAFGIHNVHLFANEVTQQVNLNYRKSSELRFNAIFQRHKQLLTRTFEKLETALLFQTYEARRSLQAPSGCVRLDPEENDQRRYDLVSGDSAMDPPGTMHHVYRVHDHPLQDDARRVDALKALSSVYQTIDAHLGSLVLRHFTVIDNMVSVFPCNPGNCAAAQGDYGAWYRSALNERVSYWSAPYIDLDSGRPAIALSLPLFCQEEEIFGVTSIVIDLKGLLDFSVNPSTMEDGLFAFIGVLKKDPRSGRVMIQIFTQVGRTGEGDNPRGKIMAADLDFHWDDDRYDAILNDFLRLRSNSHQVRFDGHESYWAFSPISHLGAGLVLVIPAQQKTEVMGLLAAIQERTRRVEIFTAAFLILLVLAVTITAVYFSKIVTQPLEKLTRAAKKLAGGDLKAHVSVDSHDEIGELGLVFNRIGPQLSQAYDMRRSVELASEIQKHLLPKPPRIAGFDIFGLTLYSDLAGGDYYDFLCDEADQGRLCVAIGDVSGHGISSALLMASVRSALRMRSRLAGSLGEIANSTNAVFSEDVEASSNFVTLFLARFDHDGRRIRWIRAGHDPALLYDPDAGTFTELMGKETGLPFGVNETEAYFEESHPFHPGQICFLGTDGIWEAQNVRGEFFGREPVKQILRENSDASARGIATSVMDAVEAFQADAGRADDFTCVVVKFTG
ncbi:MAG: SpoIIE family protein phosphatase [Desulfosarcina sp.]|nr:SpoIIE family protein phosphatase [Desulfobacterales bacterium]